MSRTEETSPLSRDLRARISAYLGLLAAYLAAVRNDPLTPLMLSFYAAACGWSLGFEGRFRKPFFSQPVKIVLIAVGAALFVMFVARSAGSGTEQFANVISRFLFWNAVVFVLSRNKSEYDLWTLAIIELSLFMISGSFVQPALFVPLLLASTASLLCTFLRVAYLRCGPAGEAQKGGASVVFVTLLLAVEVGAVLFVAFPRSLFRGDRPAGAELPAARKDVPPEGLPVASKEERTGIPEQPQFLDLASYRKLKADPRPVAKLRVRDLQGGAVPADRTPYLRGAVLDTYEGGRWKASYNLRVRSDGDDGARDGWIALDRNPAPGRMHVMQQIHQTRLGGDLAFGLPDLVRVQLQRARWDPAGRLFLAQAPDPFVEYFAESALMPLDVPRDVKPFPPPAAWLQVPESLERLKETARRAVAGAPEGSIHAKAARIQNWLMRNGFAYKLDPFAPAEGKDAVEHFLDKRAGYCTHFASALVLMCRAAGVPARVATGFQLHDPLDDGSFLIRSSDAHAWAEVWFGPEHGWRAYDATPAEGRGPGPMPEGAAVASTDVKKPEDGAPKKSWDRLIVEFDPSSQGETLGVALRALGAFFARVGAVLVSPPALVALAGLLAAAVASWMLMPASRRRRLRQIVSGFREPATVDFYRDFLWALSRRGIRKHPALTPAEFAVQLRPVLADEGIDFVTAKFYEQRYRGTPPSPEDRRRLDAIVQRLLMK
jgi:transglutaminase-like putative cysteine protease